MILTILKIEGAVWVDEEEANLEIDLNAVSRLKKLKKGDSVTKVSGLEFSESLKERLWNYYILMVTCIFFTKIIFILFMYCTKRFNSQLLEWAVPQQSDQGPLK